MAIFDIILVFGFVFFSAAIDPQKLCRELLALNCKSYQPIESDESVCGTDGVLYDNYCEFGQANCKNPSIEIKQVGHCKVGATLTNPPTTTVTMPPTTTTTPPPSTTLDFKIQLVCMNKDVITCSDNIDLICGSDYRLYQNSCKFTLAHCDNHGLRNLTLTECRNHQG